MPTSRGADTSNYTFIDARDNGKETKRIIRGHVGRWLTEQAEGRAKENRISEHLPVFLSTSSPPPPTTCSASPDSSDASLPVSLPSSFDLPVKKEVKVTSAVHPAKVPCVPVSSGNASRFCTGITMDAIKSSVLDPFQTHQSGIVEPHLVAACQNYCLCLILSLSAPC